MDRGKAPAQAPARPHKTAAGKAPQPDCLDGSCTGALALHEAVGNGGLLRLMRSGHLRTKRQISAPGDPWEQEAERVAATILSQPPKAMVHRACTCGTDAPCDECQEQPVFRKGAGQIPSSAALQDEVGTVTGSSGERLDRSTREFFEERFDQGFDDVRIHTGREAAESARAIAADAYTVGADIVFGQGRYSPATTSGRHLLAHELTHVVQQRHTAAGSLPAIQRQPTEPKPFRLDDPDPVTQNVSVAEPPEPEPENVSRGEPEPAPDVPEGPVCRPEADLVCEREGDPEPLGPTIEFEDMVFAANADYLDWLLRREVRLFGLDETARLIDRFLGKHAVLPAPVMSQTSAEQFTGASAPARALRGLQERLWGEIPLAVHDAFHRVKQQVTTYLKTYERAAEANLLTLLARSEARVDAERIRYGLQSKEDILHYWSPLRLDAEMRKNPTLEDVVPALKELHTAAGILYKLKTQLELTRLQTTTLRGRSASTMLLTRDIGTWQSAYISYSQQTTHVVEEARLYEFQKAELTERYPVLAAYESDMEKLRLLATGSPVEVMVSLHDKMYKILTNIASVREDVNDHDVNIWKLPRLISATNLALGVQGDSLEDALIKQKVQDENDESFWTSIGLAVAQVGLVLLAPVTGGLSLIGAAAISGYMAAKSVEEYRQQSALSGTDFDRALAIAAEEPSLFWVAMDVVLFIPDAFAALKAFRTVKELLASYRAAKSADDAADVLGRLKASATVDGGSVFAQRMVDGAQAGKDSGLRRLFGAADAEALEAAEGAAASVARAEGVVERVTAAGTVKITPGGHVVVCENPCYWLRDRFARTIAGSGEYETRLAGIESKAARAEAEVDEAAAKILKEEAAVESQRLLRDLVGETIGSLPLSRPQWTALKGIEESLEKRGLDWTNLGFKERQELVEFLSPPHVDEALSQLQRRLDLLEVHGAAQQVGTSRTVGLPSRQPPPVTDHRIPAGTDVPDPRMRRGPGRDPDLKRGGFWGGEPGHSEWFPDSLAVNQVTQYRPVPFRRGFPDFTAWIVNAPNGREGRVWLRTITGVDRTDFAAADRLLARTAGFKNQTAVAEWRKASHYTWHHVEDGHTLILVPTALNDGVPHVGGASLARP